jgi:hypothetical protein
MKQVVLDVPDNKWNFFLELVKSLRFIKLHGDEDAVIPEEHKKIVRERMRTAKKDDFVEWKTIKKKYNLK